MSNPNANATPNRQQLATLTSDPVIQRALEQVFNGQAQIGSGSISGVTLSFVSSPDPVNNGDISVSAASNTSLVIKYKGTDGVIRSIALTLA